MKPVSRRITKLLPLAVAIVCSSGLFAADAEELLRRPDRPARPPLPASELPLPFIPGERIALVGNSTAERMNLFGYFETMLHQRFGDLELVVRNFARPADEVGVRQRPTDYTKLDDPLQVFGADTFFCFFGFNESFAGAEGVAQFQRDYHTFLDQYARQYPRDDTGAAPRFVLISPLAFEPPDDRLLPAGGAENERLERYASAVRGVAQERDLAFVDLFTPTAALFAAEPGLQFTINGCHQNEAGDREIARLLHEALFSGQVPSPQADGFEQLREAVNDKSWVHSQDYRMVNGWYVYGGRRTWDTETFPREFLKIRNMAAVRDRYIWDIAQGKPVSAVPDDSQTGDLFVPETRFGQKSQSYSEAAELRYLTPKEFVETCTIPDGFELQPFADETMFPELANPVQLDFDAAGRLWVAVMPTYPMWKPGDPKPNDKLLILEDQDGDGRADTCKTFYDGLHCPTGFDFFGDGVLVTSQPRLLWIKDTDGDDAADQVVHYLDGFATDDTHHSIGAFETDHSGRLHMLEGVAMSTTVETPWGPFRNFGTPGAYVLEPRSQRLRHFVTPGYGNPWCLVFDQWGQGIVGDGTMATQHWATPLSGAQYRGRRGLKQVFNNDGLRPAVGSEFLVSRQFPDPFQGDFTYGCVINMNGMPRFEITEEDAGFDGGRVKEQDQPQNVLSSTDKHFRPVDPKIGPDGALWFGDWSNALIGHMQYSQRDPNRDHQRGRIYRLVYTGKPLVAAATQRGKSHAEVLQQLRQPEWRARQRARRDLAGRPTAEVLAAVDDWLGDLEQSDPEHDRLICEALWIQAAHHAVDPALLQRGLQLATHQARAAAVRIAADQREWIDGELEILQRMARDEHPRVRLEAIRGLSFFPTATATDAVLAAAELPTDYWLRYTLDAALAANEPVWRPAYLTGQLSHVGADAKAMLTDILKRSEAGSAAMPYLQTLLGSGDVPAEQRHKAITALADMKGDANQGRQVFRRSCINCHKLGDEGQDYGPRLSEVAPQRSRFELAESVLDPNAKVDDKYVTTVVVTTEGRTVKGLLVQDSAEQLAIHDGEDLVLIPTDTIEGRKQLKQSSMPEGLAAALAPAEFLDLIEFLDSIESDQ